jgi:hypothetical protein
LQQHDGLAICDLATVDHRNRLVEPEFEHFDILAFAAMPPPSPMRSLGVYSLVKKWRRSGTGQGETRSFATILLVVINVDAREFTFLTCE